METKNESSPQYQIIVDCIGKKFNQQKLFSKLSFTASNNEIIAITGANGSGKSTLLKIISGTISPTKGEVKFLKNQQKIPSEKLQKHLSICAPYLELIEEFTLEEHLKFHNKFKKQWSNTNVEEEIKNAGLSSDYKKIISDFSSGMKQRLKLILSLCYEGEFLMLDEPTSHLDKNGKNWYKDLLTNYSKDRITIIFSNESEEYTSFTKKIINIE